MIVGAPGASLAAAASGVGSSDGARHGTRDAEGPGAFHTRHDSAVVTPSRKGV